MQPSTAGHDSPASDAATQSPTATTTTTTSRCSSCGCVAHAIPDGISSYWDRGAAVYDALPINSPGTNRAFYTAKASRSEREAWGRMTIDPQRRSDGREKDIENPRLRTSQRVNDHPTVKPLALMEWLIKLVVPEGGIVLDPFAGSGSTLVAAKRLNVRAIGIEQDERSAEIARQRLAAQWEVRLI